MHIPDGFLSPPVVLICRVRRCEILDKTCRLWRATHLTRAIACIVYHIYMEYAVTLVGWASCPSHQLMKRIFARGLLFLQPFGYSSLLF